MRFTHVRPFQRDPLSKRNYSSAIKTSSSLLLFFPRDLSFRRFLVSRATSTGIRKAIKLPLIVYAIDGSAFPAEIRISQEPLVTLENLTVSGSLALVHDRMKTLQKNERSRKENRFD